MPLFQYQGKVEPLLPIAPPALAPLTWLPTYPDHPQHHRPRQDPQLFYVPLPLSTTEVRVTQAPLEALIQYSAPLTRVTDVAVETLIQYSIRHVRVTQLAVEVIYPFGCYTFHPGPPAQPASCPVSLQPDANTTPCADEAPPFP